MIRRIFFNISNISDDEFKKYRELLYLDENDYD